MPLSGRTRSSKRIANGTTTDGPTHDRSTPWATRVRGTGTADRQTGPPACLVDPLRVPCAVPGDLRHVRRFPRSARGVDVAARLGLPAAEQAVPRAGQLPEPVRLRLLGLLPVLGRDGRHRYLRRGFSAVADRAAAADGGRSEERRVGKEWRAGWGGGELGGEGGGGRW